MGEIIGNLILAILVPILAITYTLLSKDKGKK